MATERMNVALTEEERDRHAREAGHLMGQFREREDRAKALASEAREELKELGQRNECEGR